jgi:hypothetical protein
MLFEDDTIKTMPELTRFLGIIIRMYTEPNEPHNTPHFHAYYQNEAAIFSIKPLELIGGSMSKRQQRLIEVWADLYQDELLINWKLLQKGKQPVKIRPLK